MTVRPLRPATDRRLGELLPHQLANRTRAPPSAPEDFPLSHLQNKAYAVLARVSPGYPPPKGRSPTRYSPVRHFTRTPKDAFPFDLHVLGTPPALILSQDQTLKFKSRPATCPVVKDHGDNIPCTFDRAKYYHTESEEMLQGGELPHHKSTRNGIVASCKKVPEMG